MFKLNQKIALGCMKLACKCSETGRIKAEQNHVTTAMFMFHRSLDLVELSLVFYDWRKEAE